MKDKSKILPRIIIIALVVALISTVVLSAVYAKYVSKGDANASARPAVFELVMNSPRDEAIEFNFAVDGEPGAPIGYTEAKKSFDFSVKTSASEVSAEYFVTVDFNSKITAMINKARENRFQDGICCDYEVYRYDSNLQKYVKIEGEEDESLDDSGEKILTWTYQTKTEPHKNPDGSSGTDEKNKPVVAKYRLVITAYNNTMMPSDGNTLKYVFSSNAVTVSVMSRQDDPGYSGEFEGIDTEDAANN